MTEELKQMNARLCRHVGVICGVVVVLLMGCNASEDTVTDDTEYQSLDEDNQSAYDSGYSDGFDDARAQTGYQGTCYGLDCASDSEYYWYDEGYDDGYEDAGGTIPTSQDDCCDGSTAKANGWEIRVGAVQDPEQPAKVFLDGTYSTPYQNPRGNTYPIFVYEYTVEGSDGYYEHGGPGLVPVRSSGETSAFFSTDFSIPGAQEGTVDCIIVVVRERGQTTGMVARLCAKTTFERIQL